VTLKLVNGRPQAPAEDGATMQYTDDANALDLVERFGDRIRYVTDRGAWLTWDGHRWVTADRTGGQVREHAKTIGRSIEVHDKDAARWKKQTLSSAGTSAMLTQAATDQRITVATTDLDAHPMLLNTPDGVADLHTGHLTPPRPDQLHTRSTTVGPDFDQPTPRWKEFLDDTFEGREELIPYVQRLLGYSATGSVTNHVLPFLHGPGGNGKSVFLDVARALLGDYAGTAPGKFLMAGQPQHETEVARLAGMRLVICSEVNQADKFDEAKVKLLTGGDTLTARFMRADHFSFQPTHKLWLMGNHQPRVSGGGDSFWRRLRMIKFDNSVPEEKQVDGLAEDLVDKEGPGILAWIIQGARDVHIAGLQTPESVRVDTKAYADEEDSLARFLDDRCHKGGDHNIRVETGVLRSAYEHWCRDEGETPMTATAFGRELKTIHGVEQGKSNGRRFYLRLALLNPEDD
jgi:putative DNA primase/helicase